MRKIIMSVAVRHRALLLLGGLILIGLVVLAALVHDTLGQAPLQLQPSDTAARSMLSDSPAAIPTPPNPEGNNPPPSTDGEARHEQSPPSAVITSLGIPVAVIRQTDAGYLVQTPCGNTAEVATGAPIESVQVVIDPGHGGNNTGAIGPNGLVESHLNLELSRAVLSALADRGIHSATTRTADYGMLLSTRSAFADALGAEALVSIHHNAPTWDSSNIPGTEVFIQSATVQQARTDSARLGGLLYEEITMALATFDDIVWSRLSDAGVLRVLQPGGQDLYGMIRRPTVPSVLVEYGYLSNPSEAELFATDEYIGVAAKATADAIDAYLHSNRPGTGFVQEPRVFNLPSNASSDWCTDPPLE